MWIENRSQGIGLLDVRIVVHRGPNKISPGKPDKQGLRTVESFSDLDKIPDTYLISPQLCITTISDFPSFLYKFQGTRKKEHNFWIYSAFFSKIGP